MVRVTYSDVVKYGKGNEKVSYREYAGLSTDTKPTEGVATGSVFLEVDTTDVYLYDEASEEWNKVGE